MKCAPIFRGIAAARGELGVALGREIPVLLEFKRGIIHLADLPQDPFSAMQKGRGHRDPTRQPSEYHLTVSPPSITMALPVTNEESSEARTAPAFAISSGEAIRRN